DQRTVMVVAADGTVTPRPVVLGPLVDGLRVIRSGVTAQDRVVINGNSRIQQPGQKVQPTAGKITRTPQANSAPVTTAPPAATATSASALSGSVAIGD